MNTTSPADLKIKRPTEEHIQSMDSHNEGYGEGYDMPIYEKKSMPKLFSHYH